MRMKNITVSIAAAALAAGVLAGCGQSGTAGASSSVSSESTASAGESTQEAASSADHLSRIKAAGVITVATEGDWAPFTYHDEATNDLVGFDIETAQEIAKRLGVTAEFKEGDFDGGLTGVSQGTFDMMANGVDAVKAAATDVTRWTNDESGVARTVAELFGWTDLLVR